MKKVTTPSGVFGPYQVVEVLPDRYRCDGADLPFTVVGQGTVSNAQPGDFTPHVVAPTRTRDAVLADLATLDTKSIRALCEQDTSRIAALEAQKVALRNELRAM